MPCAEPPSFGGFVQSLPLCVQSLLPFGSQGGFCPSLEQLQFCLHPVCSSAWVQGEEQVTGAACHLCPHGVTSHSELVPLLLCGCGVSEWGHDGQSMRCGVRPRWSLGHSVHAKEAEWGGTRSGGTLSPRSRRLPHGASVHAIVCFRCCGVSVPHGRGAPGMLLSSPVSGGKC